MFSLRIAIRLVFGWLFVIGPVSPLFADETRIHFAGTEEPDLFTASGNGPYQKLFDLIKKQSSAEMTLSISPYNRAFNNFRSKRADCLYTGAINKDNFLGEGVQNGDYINSDTINVLKLKVYTQDPDPIIDNIDEMKGHAFAATHALVQVIRTTLPHVAKETTLAPVELLDDAFQLAEIGKVKGVMSFDTNALVLQRQRNAGPGFRASETFNLRRSEEAIVCHKTDRNINFVEEANNSIRSLIRSGTLDELFAR